MKKTKDKEVLPKEDLIKREGYMPDPTFTSSFEIVSREKDSRHQKRLRATFNHSKSDKRYFIEVLSEYVAEGGHISNSNNKQVDLPLNKEFLTKLRGFTDKALEELEKFEWLDEYTSK